MQTERDHPMFRGEGAEVELLCRECGFEYVHPTLVYVNRGGEITRVDSAGTHLEAGTAAGRGVLIGLTFACENGHRFEITFQFHKGLTLTAVDVLDWPEAVGDILPNIHTIWRD